MYGLYGNNEIDQFNKQHELAYNKAIESIKIATHGLSNKAVGDDSNAVDRVQQALKIKATIIDHLLADEQDIKAVFANPAIFSNMLKDNKIASDAITNVTQLFTKLHAHSNEHIFTMKGVCKNMSQVMYLDSIFRTDQNKQEAKTQESDLVATYIPSDIFNEIAIHLTPSDIILRTKQPESAPLVEAATVFTEVTIATDAAQTNLIGEVI